MGMRVGGIRRKLRGQISAAHILCECSGYIAFDFSGAGLQGLGDESWGLDNVRVSLLGAQAPTAVPVPAVLPLLGVGFIGMLWARRSKHLS